MKTLLMISSLFLTTIVFGCSVSIPGGDSSILLSNPVINPSVISDNGSTISIDYNTSAGSTLPYNKSIHLGIYIPLESLAGC